ncbi:antirestriction protein [Halomonas sp. AOP1-B1-8]|uniref:antirestriction protein n=1 Tax=Halomonas sp. AOP1-B1-8 TaxID=3457726 RepID=UPI003FDBB175
MQNAIDTITAQPVPESKRLALLPKYAGQQCVALENEIMHAMRMMCEDYQGGLWNFYELSDNSACYMAPGKDEQLNIVVAGNFYSGTMSADAAGIVATLVGLNRLAWSTRQPRFTNQFHALRLFACGHPENRAILRAID